MKNILLSLLVVVAVGGATIAATSAYFSDSVDVAGNTFATGTVTIGGSNGLPLTLTNIGPGLSQAKDVDIQYVGTLNADIYVGAGGTSSPGQPQYLADHMNLNIWDRVTAETWMNTYVNYASTHWVKIGSNVAPNEWNSYRLTFAMDADVDNTHQGVSNTDTVLKFFAVQTGGPVPATVPYLSSDPYSP
jgi:predicted ribosomally synthesized peptide with SipW-like signal peptide